MRLKPSVKRFVFFSLVLLSAYGINRLYFHLTEGFTLSNITFYSAFPTAFQPQWEVRPLLSDEQIELKKAINQPDGHDQGQAGEQSFKGSVEHEPDSRRLTI